MLLVAPTAGLVVALLPWGWLTDRVRERIVMAVGLLGGAGARRSLCRGRSPAARRFGCSSQARRGPAWFQNTGNFVSATITPPVMGLLISPVGYRPAFALLAVPAALSARLLTRLPADS